MELQISNYRAVNEMPSKTEIRKAVSETLRRCGRKPSDPYELSIVFTGKEEIREVNRKYRNINRATDVISFAFCEGEGACFAPFLLGDIMVCPEIISIHEKKYGSGLKREMIFVIIHGLLHLLGYDHDTAAKRKAMREKETEIMDVLFK